MKIQEKKHLNDAKAFIECSNAIYDIYNNNSERKGKNFIVFNEKFADSKSNKEFKSVLIKLFIRCKKLNISFYLSYNLNFLFQNKRY